jgi:hypothetical protein
VVLNATVGQPTIGLSATTGRGLCAGFWCFGGSRVVAVEPGVTIANIALGPAIPTPARGDVSFAVELPRRADVSLRVYDISGRQVGALYDGALDAGAHRITWENQAGSGRSQGVGVYFARLVVNGRMEGERRVILVH